MSVFKRINHALINHINFFFQQINFAFLVWRKFPQRIVGFPCRSHHWDPGLLRWHYSSQWTNECSMVLTSAAFYHRWVKSLGVCVLWKSLGVCVLWKSLGVCVVEIFRCVCVLWKSLGVCVLWKSLGVYSLASLCYIYN